MLSFVASRRSRYLTVVPLSDSFLHLISFFLVFHFCRMGEKKLRRGAWGAVWPPSSSHRVATTIVESASCGLSTSRGVRIIINRAACVFFFSRVSSAATSSPSFSPSLCPVFSRKRGARQIGDIKRISTVVMRVQTCKRSITTGCFGGASRSRTFDEEVDLPRAQ